jgi:hypothetical protein
MDKQTTHFSLISAYNHWSSEFEYRSWQSVLDATLCDKVLLVVFSGPSVFFLPLKQRLNHWYSNVFIYLQKYYDCICVFDIQNSILCCNSYTVKLYWNNGIKLHLILLVLIKMIKTEQQLALNFEFFFF